MATQRQQQQCVGCGRIDTCAKNRRLTTTEAGMKVKETWELFVKEKLKGDYGTPDQTKRITDDDVMCRTCFSNYERYAKAREVIDEAIKGFMKFECEPELGPPCKSGKVTVSFHCSVYTPGITLTTII